MRAQVNNIAMLLGMPLASTILIIILCSDFFVDSASGANGRRTYALESPGSGRSYGNCNGWTVNRVTRRYGDMMSCDRHAKRLRRGYSDHMKVLSWTFIYFITSLHRMIKLPTDNIMFKYAMPHVIHLASLPT